MNLRFGSTLAIPKPDKPFAFDLRRGKIAAFLAEVYREIEIDSSGGFSLQPNHFVLGRTKERVRFPIRKNRPCYAARIEGRSRFARIGLIVHFTAPTIHAGYEGTITLEMINLGANPISLYADMEICQLIIEQVSSTPFLNPSDFHGQSRPAGAV